MSDAEYDPRYLKGIEYFNECEFFEAHDEWEELWQEYWGPDRTFYQGLIQVAVCLHHFGNGNIRGARKLYEGSRGYLQEYLPFHNGLDLQKLFDEFAECCAEINASEEQFPEIEIVPDLIPEIHLDPPPAT
ncbi:MAG: DUF309 domain-containing protein [Planctomycetales bacterium]|nr:DUF309 domain-containing protein [Planctomycetales bacterium]